MGAEDFGFIFPKGSDLVAPVNAAIAELKADGTLRRAEQEVVPRLQDGRVALAGAAAGPARDFPWWLAAVAAIGALLLALIVTDPVYRNILALLSQGHRRDGLRHARRLRARLGARARAGGLRAVALDAARQTRARFYIEVMRGLPILVLLLYIAFVAAPALVAGWNALAGPLGLRRSRPATSR